MDEDQLGTLQALASGIVLPKYGQALDAPRETGPGGQFLGYARTRRHFESAFWRSGVFDDTPFRTRFEEGGRDTRALAAQRARRMLAAHAARPPDPAAAEALADCVARGKA